MMIAMMMMMNMIDWTKKIAYDDVDVTQKYNKVHNSTGWMNDFFFFFENKK